MYDLYRAPLLFKRCLLDVPNNLLDSPSTSYRMSGDLYTVPQPMLALMSWFQFRKASNRAGLHWVNTYLNPEGALIACRQILPLPPILTHKACQRSKVVPVLVQAWLHAENRLAHELKFLPRTTGLD